MHHHYDDILDRIKDAPTWFDENGVPRYCAFSPGKLANIYACEAALAEISCQSCKRNFTVAMDGRFARKGRALCDEIRLGSLDYGDPPNMRCCPAGPTMGSVTQRVVEYWSSDTELHTDWQRDPAYEGPAGEACEPIDVVLEVLTAVNSGQTTICIQCTSKTNRYDVAGRVTAGLAQKESILVTSPSQISGVAIGMLRGLVAEEGIGHARRPGSVTVVPFEQLSEILPAMFGTIIVLTGVPPWETYVQARKDQHEKVWAETKAWLNAALTTTKTLIEFRLAGRCRLLENPTTIIDGWKTTATK